MKSFFQFLFRSFAGASTLVIVWLISYLAFDQSLVISLLYGLLGGACVGFLLKWYHRSTFLRENGLTRREYQYIKKNLKEAKLKINRLQKAMFRTRSLTNMKQNLETVRLVNKIYAITKKEPKRFYQAESFYYKNLDSLVEISEKYAFLHSQPAKTPELTHSLQDTRIMMNRLTDTLEKDLYAVLEDDIDNLNFELDFAKKTLIQSPTDKDNRGR
ncbi:5-bromo-4-chloroindolyl phosphate hydrolysis family protein [Niallia endozanthoxylica]|uniref:Protein xpaC n=1 Tax=Niallia endozanthoxylica TaxID=2036016 RepID=A0A5J5HN71_9BACI|nr:5-bromo-4-chloroindolyl phosphate hydrolysis family protein [Niallia endozanthoxylica]KAA9021806.1 protein xpaC [Niallia endozanthoxylica]